MKVINTVIRNRRPLHWSRSLIVLSIAVAVIGVVEAGRRIVAAESIGTQSVVEFQIPDVPMFTGTFQAINNGPGQQYDPHIDCDLVSYTSDDDQGALTVRYYDFATHTDQPVPGNGADSLSDVYGGRIAFLEGTNSGPRIVIFDIVSQTLGAIPFIYSPALGGNLMAFDDRSSSNSSPSEVGVYEIGGVVIARLSSDFLFDRNPAVSPTGNAVVWEKCQTNESGCDIYAAIRTGPTTFDTIALTGAEGEDRAASTNGEVAVYTSNRNGDTDIYIQSLVGGPETRLSIPGIQRDPNISGDLISFESQVDTQYDIFVYDISSGNLYRVTNTAVNETLSEISVCNGIGRIVYAAPAADFDVFAFTFQPPSPAVNQINDLIETVESFDLPAGTENSLVTKLQDALAAISLPDTATACDSLTAFINAAQAQSAKKLTADQVSQLINSANQIKTGLGCQ